MIPGPFPFISPLSFPFPIHANAQRTDAET